MRWLQVLDWERVSDLIGLALLNRIASIDPAPLVAGHGTKPMTALNTLGQQMKLSDFKALTFDVYGTLIDW